MGDPTMDLIARLQSMQGANGVSKGCFGGLLPDADVSGGLQLMVCGIGKNPLNTPITSLVNGGRFGAKGGQQALLAKIGAQISSDFQKANNDAQAYKANLAAGVENAGIQQAASMHGLPPNLKNNNGNGGRSA